MTFTSVSGCALTAVAAATAVAENRFVPAQYVDVPAAVAASLSGDSIRVELTAAGGSPGTFGYNFGRGVDFGGRSLALDFNGSTTVTLDRSAVVTLANASSVQFDGSVAWSGTVVVPAGATASWASTQTIFTSSGDVSIAQLLIGAGGSMTLVANSLNLGGTIRLAPNSRLTLQSLFPSTTPGFTVIAEAGASIGWSHGATFGGTLTSLAGLLQTGPTFTIAQSTPAGSSVVSVINGTWIGSDISNAGATVNISNSTLVARSLALVGETARLNGSGQWFVDLNVGAGAQATFIGNSTVTGAYTNAGRTVVQTGTLTITGSLTNTGQLVGNVVGPRGPGGPPPALSVAGRYTSSDAASLLLPGSSLSVTGELIVEIDSGTRFDLRSSTVRVGAPGGVAVIEAPAEDVGPVPAAFSRGPTAFPIGTLIIGGEVSIVDLADNAAPQPDALYVLDLRIPAGASLVTGGRRVYYRTLNLAGQVDNPYNLVAVSFCAADFNGSGALTVEDLFSYLVAYFNGDPRADVNGVGGVTVQDVFDYLALYFTGCP